MEQSYPCRREKVSPCDIGKSRGVPKQSLGPRKSATTAVLLSIPRQSNPDSKRALSCPIYTRASIRAESRSKRPLGRGSEIRHRCMCIPSSSQNSKEWFSTGHIPHMLRRIKPDAGETRFYATIHIWHGHRLEFQQFHWLEPRDIIEILNNDWMTCVEGIRISHLSPISKVATSVETTGRASYLAHPSTRPRTSYRNEYNR